MHPVLKYGIPIAIVVLLFLQHKWFQSLSKGGIDLERASRRHKYTVKVRGKRK